ncbi:MAG: CBS domain-containing protein [Candidatus Eisenbacteria bacterium]|uniref:CBS domain-containing protein n=1 Tax=Eiseniibacteriota bacterium TaxID=2212470 RepID=A0A948RWU2_UNCEI|nr:CBS domain-containing protein [Candidatus Eisenbacteria bacterium]MBU1948045.1 CBS domain-containing protein [Candidatus Eisenbacteria bacterium]MBU2689704.1 CBS domain-containing protein [Candidatus Eisenbacteria bacterium]
MSVSPALFGTMLSFAVPFLAVLSLEWWGGRRPFRAGTSWALVWSLMTGGIAVATLLPDVVGPVPAILISPILILFALVVGWIRSRPPGEKECDPGTEPELEPADQELFNRVLTLRSTPAGKIMTPAEKIVYCRSSATVEDLRTVIQRSGYSRIPIMDSMKGPVRGFVQAKDLAASLHNEGSVKRAVEFSKDIIRVGPREPVSRLLDAFRQRRIHLALVADGRGRPMGMVTLGDIYRHLLGVKTKPPRPAS